MFSILTGNNLADHLQEEMDLLIKRAADRLEDLGAVEVNTVPMEQALQQLFALSTGDGSLDADIVKQDIQRLKEHPRDQPEVLGRIYEHCAARTGRGEQLIQIALQMFFGSLLGEEVVVPESFWSTPFGRIVLEVRKGSPDVLLTAGDAGLLLGVSRQYIHDEMMTGKIPYQTVGKYGVIRLADLLQYEMGRRKR